MSGRFRRSSLECAAAESVAPIQTTPRVDAQESEGSHEFGHLLSAQGWRVGVACYRRFSVVRFFSLPFCLGGIMVSRDFVEDAVRSANVFVQRHLTWRRCAVMPQLHSESVQSCQPITETRKSAVESQKTRRAKQKRRRENTSPSQKGWKRCQNNLALASVE